MADSRSVTPGTKPRMITLLIADRRHGTDDLAEVHVPLKAAGAGCKGCPAKTFLRVSADGEEATRPANLKVKTLPVIVEGVRVSYYHLGSESPHVVMPAPFLRSNSSSLVSTGRGAPVMNTVHPLTPYRVTVA
ncbi:hypothetical protein V8E52_009494 [Russula decolorans]